MHTSLRHKEHQSVAAKVEAIIVSATLLHNVKKSSNIFSFALQVNKMMTVQMQPHLEKTQKMAHTHLG
jgi:hypothetical protein